MNLQVTLFESPEVLTYQDREYGKFINRGYKLLENPSELIYRDVSVNCGLRHDSLFELDVNGDLVGTHQAGYIISFQNRLDIALSRLSDCSPEEVHQMLNYDKISKALLTLDPNLLDFTLGEFFGLSNKLDDYLLTFFSKGSVKLLLGDFITEINKQIERCLFYLGFYIHNRVDGFSFRGISDNRLFITTNNKELFKLDELSILLDKDSSSPIKIDIKEMIR